MWSNFNPTEIQTDFERVRDLGANTVRVTIDPFQFGWPNVTPQMASELSQVMSLAGAQGLHVQLTLFDWWTSYSEVSSSQAWLRSLLSGYANDPQIAFIELQNEIDPTNPAAMAWATAILPVARSVVGDIPLTFSISSTQGISGVLALKAALSSEALNFYDIHYYGSGGAAASLLGAVQAAVAPTPLFVGEAGFSTYTTAGAGEQALLDSDEASFYAALEEATASLGLPPAAPYMLDDLVGSGVPYPESTQPADWYYGLYTSAGPPKPAAAVVQQFFTTGSEPLVLDPGFQTQSGGVPTGWTFCGPGTPAWSSALGYGSSHSVEISGSSQDISAWSTLINTGALTTTERLQATVWAQGSAATGSNMAAVAWFGPSGNYLGNTTSSPLPDGTSNWTELGVNATAPAGAAYAMLYLQSSGNSGSVSFADAAAAVVTGAFPALPAVPITSGVGPTLANASFESGANGLPTAWTPSAPSTGNLTWSSTVAHTGTYSVEISGSQSQQDLAAWTQTINTGALTAGEELQATVWAQGSAATGSNMAAVAWFGPSGNYLGNTTSSPLPDGTSNWTELGVNATAPAGAAYALLYLQSSGNSGSVWFDDASATIVTGAFPALAAVAVTSGVGPTLANASFESGANGLPTAWTPSAPSTGNLTWSSTVAHTGTYSVEISGSQSPTWPLGPRPSTPVP